MRKVNDSFYRSMTGNQLQAAYKEIEANLKYDNSPGMQVEKELIQNVASERGITLGNPFEAVRGYVEFGVAVQQAEPEAPSVSSQPDNIIRLYEETYLPGTYLLEVENSEGKTTSYLHSEESREENTYYLIQDIEAAGETYALVDEREKSKGVNVMEYGCELKDISTAKGEIDSIKKGPLFLGSDYEYQILKEINNEADPAELKLLLAFELGRRSILQGEQAKEKAHSDSAEKGN